MAWREGDGGRQFRKDGTAAKRSQHKAAALADQQDAPAPHKKKRMPKPHGLRLYWRSHLFDRETWSTIWYFDAVGRAQAKAKFEKETICKLPRYTRIEEVER